MAVAGAPQRRRGHRYRQTSQSRPTPPPPPQRSPGRPPPPPWPGPCFAHRLARVLLPATRPAFLASNRRHASEPHNRARNRDSRILTDLLAAGVGLTRYRWASREPGSAFKTVSQSVSRAQCGTPCCWLWLAKVRLCCRLSVLQPEAGGTREDWSGAAELRVQAVHHARGGLPVGAA